jgi:hypothetical protein
MRAGRFALRSNGSILSQRCTIRPRSHFDAKVGHDAIGTTVERTRKSTKVSKHQRRVGDEELADVSRGQGRPGADLVRPRPRGGRCRPQQRPREPGESVESKLGGGRGAGEDEGCTRHVASRTRQTSTTGGRDHDGDTRGETTNASGFHAARKRACALRRRRTQ